MMVLKNGEESYQGEFEAGKFEGRGAYSLKSGIKVSGEFKGSRVHGSATCSLGDSGVFSGQYSQGKFVGTGTYVSSEGDKYEGEFSENGAHGHGLKTFASGAKYCGNFVADEFEGPGLLEFPNGDTYKGEFKANMMHGFGVVSSLQMKKCEANSCSSSTRLRMGTGAAVNSWTTGCMGRGSSTMLTEIITPVNFKTARCTDQEHSFGKNARRNTMGTLSLASCNQKERLPSQMVPLLLDHSSTAYPMGKALLNILKAR